MAERLVAERRKGDLSDAQRSRLLGDVRRGDRHSDDGPPGTVTPRAIWRRLRPVLATTRWGRDLARRGRGVGGDGGALAPGVDVAERLSHFTEHWPAQVVGRLNDHDVKVVKILGELGWHTHEDTDELFLVTRGELTIQLRSGDISLRPGQLFVVPRGLEHCPMAESEAHAVLIEPGVMATNMDARRIHCA